MHPPLYKRLRLQLKDARGVAALEFAFVLPVLILIAFGLIDIGRAIWTQTTLDYAVQATARCAAIGSCTASSSPNWLVYCQNHAYGVTVSCGAPTQVTVCRGQTINAYQAQGNARFTYFFPLFAGFNPANFSAQACYPT